MRFFFLSLVAKWGLENRGGGVIIAAGSGIPFFYESVERSQLLLSYFTLSCTCDKETSINPNVGVWEGGKHGSFSLVGFFSVLLVNLFFFPSFG